MAGSPLDRLAADFGGDLLRPVGGAGRHRDLDPALLEPERDGAGRPAAPQHNRRLHAERPILGLLISAERRRQALHGGGCVGVGGFDSSGRERERVGGTDRLHEAVHGGGMPQHGLLVRYRDTQA